MPKETMGRRYPETIATLLHEYLVREGLTDAEFASLVGTDQAQVSRWHRGVGIPRASWDDEMAEILGVDGPTIEEARRQGDKIRKERLGKDRLDPDEELRRAKSDLRKANAKIARLEAKLSGDDHS